MPIIDLGAPSRGLGIEAVGGSKKKEAIGLIDDVEASEVHTFTRTKNSIYRSDNFHIDSKPFSRKERSNVEVQLTSGMTVALAIVKNNVTSSADVRRALKNSLNDQHKWGVYVGTDDEFSD